MGSNQSLTYQLIQVKYMIYYYYKISQVHVSKINESYSFHYQSKSNPLSLLFPCSYLSSSITNFLTRGSSPSPCPLLQESCLFLRVNTLEELLIIVLSGKQIAAPHSLSLPKPMSLLSLTQPLERSKAKLLVDVHFSKLI